MGEWPARPGTEVVGVEILALRTATACSPASRSRSGVTWAGRAETAVSRRVTILEGEEVLRGARPEGWMGKACVGLLVGQARN